MVSTIPTGSGQRAFPAAKPLDSITCTAAPKAIHATPSPVSSRVR